MAAGQHVAQSGVRSPPPICLHTHSQLGQALRCTSQCVPVDTLAAPDNSTLSLCQATFPPQGEAALSAYCNSWSHCLFALSSPMMPIRFCLLLCFWQWIDVITILQITLLNKTDSIQYPEFGERGSKIMPTESKLMFASHLQRGLFLV